MVGLYSFLESVKLPSGGCDIKETVFRFQMCLIRQALERTNGNRAYAARILGMQRTTLCAILRRLEYEEEYMTIEERLKKMEQVIEKATPGKME